MIGLVIILALALALYAYLYIRYRNIQERMQDLLTGKVQHMEKLVPPKEYEPFLPGSRLKDRMGDLGQELDHLEVKPEIRRPHKKTAKRRGIVSSRGDIRKSYIVDALLERPKF